MEARAPAQHRVPQFGDDRALDRRWSGCTLCGSDTDRDDDNAGGIAYGYSADEDDGHLDGDRAGIQQYHAGNSVFYDSLSSFYTYTRAGGGSVQPHLLGQAQVQSNGTAVLHTILPSATHLIYASYMPTPQGAGSVSATTTVVVNGGAGEKMDLSASVSGTKGNYSIQPQINFYGVTPPTGSVQILDTSASNNVVGTLSSLWVPNTGNYPAHGFEQKTLPANAASASVVALADMDGDGIPDLVAAGTSMLAVFHGVGDGTFTQEVDYPVSNGTGKSVAVGDVNNDGSPDVFVSDSSNNLISVYLNTGSGSLGTATTYSVTGPGKVLLGNYGSGYLDIATMNASGIVILPNDGNGFFGTASTISYASGTDFASADLDNDGYLDFAITRYTFGPSGDTSVYASLGNGSFVHSYSRATNGLSTGLALVTGDFNNDGYTDLGVALQETSGSDSILALLGAGQNNNFTQNGLGYYSTNYMLATDVDGDGWNDLILQTGSSVVIEYGDDQHTGGSSIVYDPVGPVAFAGGPNGPAVSMLGDGLSDFFIGGEWLSYLELTPSTTGTNVTSTTSLAAHTLVAQYVPPSGGSYAPATSNTFTVLPMGDVKPVLTLNPTSLSYNSGPLATTITATMQALSSTMPTGSITFYDNGNAIATATLSTGGIASTTLTQPEAGTHTITAAYTGDSNYISETSVASTLTVVAETPGLTLSSSASSLLVGGVVTLTGSISSVHTNVAGEVLQFDIAGQNVTDCTITTSGSSGSCSVQIIIPSNGSLQAHVTNVLDTSGHPNLASTTSATAITGLQVAGDITIQSSTNSSYQGQSVTLTFTAPTLDGVTANGTANVYDNGTLLQAISFATSSTATITTTGFAVGTNTLTTHYNGDTNGRTFPNGSTTTVPSFTAATGTSQLNQVVVTETLSLPLTITPQNTTEGTLQTLSVFVNNSGVGITGAVVQFFDANSNPTLLGSRTVGSTSPNTGIATWTQLFSPGTHNFYVVMTLPGAGLTTHTSSQVTGTVTPATSRALALNLSETGQPGNYTSTVVANYHSNYPLGALSLLNASNGNSLLLTIPFGPSSYELPTSGTSLTAGVGALSVAVGDVNNDGKMDMVVGNYWDDTVSTYLGNGDGTFQAPIVINMSSSFLSPDKVILGDFDNDGNLDFVVVCDYQQVGIIWFGDGTGNFSRTSTTGMTSGLNVPIDTTDEIAVDLDKDGKLDLVAAGFGFNVNLSSQGYNNTFMSVTGSPVWVASADFNNDGNPDIVTANIGGGTVTTNSITVMLGDGTGNLPTITNLDIPGTPGGITTGDFDEDGNVDLAVALYDTQQIAIFRGKGDGTFYPYTLIAAGGSVGAQGIKAVDLDGDGSLDLVLLDTSMVLGNATGGTPQGENIGHGNLFTTTSSGKILYLRGDGQGNFDAAQTINVGSGTTPVFLAVGDFDGDGVADLAVSQTAGFDDNINTTSTSTVGVFLGSNTATAELTGSAVVNTAGPIQIVAEHVHGSPDAYATTYSNTVQLQSLTTAAITSSLEPSPLGSPLVLTATVAEVGGVVPTGSVQFFDGTTSLGSGTLSSGVATLTTSSLTIGGHTITAFYNGDSHYLSTSATALNQTISPTATTVTLASASNPANYGAAVVLTATTGNSAATGTVKFMNGASLLGTAQLSSGVATFTTSSLPVGTTTLTAAYLGDSNYSAATSGIVSQVINLSSAATTTLAISPTSAVFGQVVTMTATLGASAATGTVSFMNGGATLGTATVIAGVAIFNTAILNVGTYTVTAVYSGDSSYSGSTSTASSLTITQATPPLSSVIVLPPTAPYGTSVRLTQSVPAGATGTVTFYANGASIGTATISGGVATMSTSSLSVATYAITATYGGNANFATTTSSGSNAIITLAPPNLAAPTASPASANYGTSVTLTQVVPTSLTGSISFLVNGVSIGTGTISGGIATLTTTTLPAGTNTLTTTFAGNANYASGTSASGSIVITGITTATVLGMSPGSATTYGTPVT